MRQRDEGLLFRGKIIYPSAIFLEIDIDNTNVLTVMRWKCRQWPVLATEYADTSAIFHEQSCWPRMNMRIMF